MLTPDLDRSLEPGAERVVSRLEADDEERGNAITDAGDQRFGGIEQATVGGPEAGLDELASGLAASAKVIEARGRGRS
ncbi:MAG TPA: hypothetical protein VKY90_14370 [Candidatus Dormibacteraeota bacterium]|nr:hypothetical protein [Candidatus Dormibacteraeota bacterium]